MVLTLAFGNKIALTVDSVNIEATCASDLFSRSLESLHRSYGRRSLSNVRGHSSPALAHEACGGPVWVGRSSRCVNNNTSVKTWWLKITIDCLHSMWVEDFHTKCVIIKILRSAFSILEQFEEHLKNVRRAFKTILLLQNWLCNNQSK